MSYAAYREGIFAANEGMELWDNPYSSTGSSKDDFHAWFAGWCYGKKNPNKSA